MDTKQYSGNHSFLKELNIITTLRLIRSQRLISRAEAAERLGLNRSTITAIVNELLEQKLVQEVGVGTSKGGRPPTLLQFNGDAAYTVCLDWKLKRVKLHLTNMSGDPIVSETFEADDLSSGLYDPIEMAIAIADSIEKLLNQLPAKPLGLIGIGISVPGINDGGFVSSYTLQWDKVPLQSFFAERFDCPVVLNNDSYAGLLAEHHAGAAAGESDVLYVRIGQGLSASMLLNGLPYQGSEGLAGRIGHTVVQVNGRRCACGSRGCWETYASERALLHRYAELSGTTATIEQFVHFAKQSEPHAITALHEMSEYLGVGIANVINLLNPAVVLIGSELDELHPLMQGTLERTMQQSALLFLRRHVRVQFAGLSGGDSIRRGTAAMVLDKVFTPPHVKS
ncbi:ROK family transcriptional regulator [Paenibacillus koleovorans]|uniref:ROK family transcriptional regulator n=1 Tax=Paenibacillus koleovorans TaxID=121608 RepID=UPI0013E40DAC|nr:ROK family transcriptional regulator [Paenibacillus koleovorans]